jgi:hypothetical protein
MFIVDEFSSDVVFLIISAPLSIKTWRLYLLFQEGSSNALPDKQLLAYTLCFLSIDVLIISATLYSHGNSGTAPVTSFKLGTNGAYSKYYISYVFFSSYFAS